MAGGAPASIAGSSSSRRERLENIKEREELKSTLVTKFRAKYKQDSINASSLRREVSDFVSSDAPVTVSNLQRLDQRLQRQVRGQVESDTASISAYTNGGASTPRRPLSQGKQPSLSARSFRSETAVRATPSGSMSARGLGDVAYATGAAGGHGGHATDWSTFDKLAAKLQEQDAAQERLRKREMQLRLRQDLDKQVGDARLKQERERELNSSYHEQQVVAIKSWQEQEQARLAAQRHGAIRLLGSLEESVEAERRRREQEKQLEREEAQRLMDVARRGEEEAQARNEHQRQRAREQMKDALVIGDASARAREAAHREAAQKEAESVERYQRLAEARQKDMEEVHAAKAEQRLVMENVAGERSAREQGLEQQIEARASAERARKESHDVRAEKAKQEEKLQKQQATQKHLYEQMQEKQRLKRAELDRKRNMGRILETEAKDFEEIERQRIVDKRERNLQHRLELEKQIKAKMSTAPKRDAMSESEMRINRRLLEHADTLLVTGSLPVS